MQKVLPTYMLQIVILASFFISGKSSATECNLDLVKSGNFLSGTVYKSTIDLPTAAPDAAWQGAQNHIAKDGWTIQQADIAAGVITAQNARAARPTPLSVLIEKLGTGAKLSITYTTPSGSSSPDQAIRTAFCNLAEAASVGASSSDRATNPSTPAVPTRATLNSQTPTPTTQVSAAASRYVKNGLPCVLELCVGDGLEELKKVRWQPVRPDPFRVGVTPQMLWSASQGIKQNEKLIIDQAKREWQGDVSKVFRYLAQGSFDAEALLSLAGITASCTGNVIYGTYPSDAGSPTTVSIGLRYANTNSAAQKWVVVGISRSIPNSSNLSMNESQRIRDDLAERYKGMMLLYATGSGTQAQAPHGTGQVNFLGTVVTLAGTDKVNNFEKFKLHPHCGDGKKVNLD